MKPCTKCKIAKSLEYFPKHATRKDGYYNQCKFCVNAINRKYYQKNKETRKAQFKKYYEINRVALVIKNSKQTSFRRKTDLNTRIAANLRRRINHIIKGENKKGSAVKDLGCSINELKIYLEQKFKPGMSWENYGKWHIDHIKPLSKFNLALREELLKACRYDNLQPLWREENSAKGNRTED